jgi:hypothetical protein
MPRKREEEQKPRWMTECDVIRYSMRMPEDLKKTLKKEAEAEGIDMSSYVCGILGGDIKRPRPRKTPARKKKK